MHFVTRATLRRSLRKITSSESNIKSISRPPKHVSANALHLYYIYSVEADWLIWLDRWKRPR